MPADLAAGPAGTSIAGCVARSRKANDSGSPPTASCRDDEDRLLLARAAPCSRLRGRWFLPGGGVQHGESPPDSLRREIAEESGLTIVPGPLLDVLSDVRTLPDGTSLHTVRLIYQVASWHGSLRPEVDGTTDAVAWFSLDEVRDLPLARYVETGRGPAAVSGAPGGGPGDTRHHVVIIGCGFGGLFAARRSDASRSASPSSTARTTISSSRCSTRWRRASSRRARSRRPSVT